MKNILILSAVKAEIEHICQRFNSTCKKYRKLPECCQEIWQFQHKSTCYTLANVGIGVVNAAANSAVLMSQKNFSEVWMVGCCGSYKENIKQGDVIVAQEEIHGDYGIKDSHGWQSPEKFSFSFLKIHDKKYWHRFLCKTQELFVPLPYKVYYGSMLTVSTVSGSRKVAKVLEKRFGALGENMEGSAVAQVATSYGKPFMEIRGVSNTAGDRNHKHWRMDIAFYNSQKAIIDFIGICSKVFVPIATY
ncbi:MAG: futalosine hydrolase [Candidatus Brocadiae bacterium]|nr:futalosine hydrolase [Candidatus Brocadiia bacterium]